MPVFVITEDVDSDCVKIIGVATGRAEAHRMIREYYGNCREVAYQDVRDSGIDFIQTIQVGQYTYRIVVQDFVLNTL